MPMPIREKTFITKVALAVLLVLLLVSVYVVNPTFYGASTVEDTTRAPVPCDSKDAVYCTLMRRVVSGMTTGDFSMLTTSQRPLAQGATKLYAVVQNGRQYSFTHNAYINYYRSLVGNAGPLRYLSTDCTHDTCNTIFMANKLHAIVPLVHSASGWYVAIPRIYTQST